MNEATKCVGEGKGGRGGEGRACWHREVKEAVYIKGSREHKEADEGLQREAHAYVVYPALVDAGRTEHPGELCYAQDPDYANHSC